MPEGYVHQPWPSWRFGPNGQSAIFHAAEDVPAGWADTPEGAPEEDTDIVAALKKDPDAPVLELQRTLTDEQRTMAVNKLMDNAAWTQKELVKELEAMFDVDQTIEFATGWPRLKLSETIVDNGGPLNPKE